MVNTFKISFENGDYQVTRFNGSKAEAEAYFLGSVFNLGAARDNMQRCTKVETLEDAVNPMCKGCARYGTDCKGTVETVWTGCVYREVSR